jgi:hypothetical protein
VQLHLDEADQRAAPGVVEAGELRVRRGQHREGRRGVVGADRLDGQERGRQGGAEAVAQQLEHRPALGGRGGALGRGMHDAGTRPRGDGQRLECARPGPRRTGRRGGQHRRHPTAAVRTAREVPVPAQGGHQAQAGIRLHVRRVRAPRERGLDVVAFQCEPGEPARLAAAAELPFRLLGERGEVPDVRPRDRVPLAGLHQPPRGVLPDGLEQVVARAGVPVDDHQGPVHQPGQGVDGGRPLEPLAGDRADAVQGPGAPEDRQPPQQAAFGLGQQVVAPVDGRPEGALPRLGRPRAAGEQGEPVDHALGQLAHRQGRDPRGGELDRERHAVEVPADLRDGGGVVVGQPEVRERVPGAVDEQRDGGAGRAARGVTGRRDRERVDRALHLPARRQRLPARGEDAQVRTALEEALDQERAGVDQVFAVVEHQEHRPVAEMTEELVLARRRGRVAHTQCGQHRVGHELGVGDAGQPDEADAVRVVVRHRSRHLERQAGLPHAAGSGDGEQPVVLEQARDPAEVLLAAEERGEPEREPVRRRRPAAVRNRRSPGVASRCRQLRALLEDRLPEVPQLGPGHQAEFGVQCVAGALVGRESVRLPARPVERQHQAGMEPLPQGVSRDERLQVGDHLGVPAGRQLQVDERLPGGQLELGQPGDLRFRPARVGELGQRRAPPCGERLPVEPDRRCRFAVRRGTRLRDPGREAERVHVLWGGLQQIAGTARRHQRRRQPERGQRPPELGHAHLQGVVGIGGEVLAPEGVDERGCGHDPAGREGQESEKFPFAGARDRACGSADDHLDGTQDSDLHTYLRGRTGEGTGDTAGPRLSPVGRPRTTSSPADSERTGDRQPARRDSRP